MGVFIFELIEWINNAQVNEALLYGWNAFIHSFIHSFTYSLFVLSVVHRSIHSSIYLPFHPSIHLNIQSSIQKVTYPFHPSIHSIHSIHPSVHPSIHPFTFPLIRTHSLSPCATLGPPTINYLSTHPSIHPASQSFIFSSTHPSITWLSVLSIATSLFPDDWTWREWAEFSWSLFAPTIWIVKFFYSTITSS